MHKSDQIRHDVGHHFSFSRVPVASESIDCSPAGATTGCVADHGLPNGYQVLIRWHTVGTIDSQGARVHKMTVVSTRGRQIAGTILPVAAQCTLVAAQCNLRLCRKNLYRYEQSKGHRGRRGVSGLLRTVKRSSATMAFKGLAGYTCRRTRPTGRCRGVGVRWL